MRMGRIFFYAGIVAAILSLAGCGGTDVVPRDNSGTKVGVAMPAQQLLRWNRDGAYLEISMSTSCLRTTTRKSKRRSSSR